jgi:hypothetical protein
VADPRIALESGTPGTPARQRCFAGLRGARSGSARHDRFVSGTSKQPSSTDEPPVFAPAVDQVDLDVIGELCRFLEFARIVMALSWKAVILAAADRARQAAGSAQTRCQSGGKDAAKLSAICNRLNAA